MPKEAETVAPEMTSLTKVDVCKMAPKPAQVKIVMMKKTVCALVGRRCPDVSWPGTTRTG